jgi:hypothetical protein
MSRLLGARPLDEAITLDAMYRTTLYKAKNSTRIKDIGEAVRSTMYAGNTPSAEQIQDFMSRYAAAGGDVANFNRKLYEWSLSANASVANKVFEHLKNPLNQQMSIIMGGRPLPDYSMSYATPNKRGEEPTMPAIPNLKAASTAVSM